MVLVPSPSTSLNAVVGSTLSLNNTVTLRYKPLDSGRLPSRKGASAGGHAQFPTGDSFGMINEGPRSPGLWGSAHVLAGESTVASCSALWPMSEPPSTATASSSMLAGNGMLLRLLYYNTVHALSLGKVRHFSTERTCSEDSNSNRDGAVEFVIHTDAIEFLRCLRGRWVDPSRACGR